MSTKLIILLLIFSFFSVSGFQAQQLKADSIWFEIFSGKDKVGYTHLSKVEEGGFFKIKKKTYMKLKVLGTQKKVSILSNYVLKGAEINTFSFKMDSGSTDLHLVGMLKDNQIFMTETETGSHFRFSVLPSFIVPSEIPSFLSNNGLRNGAVYEVFLFDPLSLYMGVDQKDLKAEVLVEDRETVDTNHGEFLAYKVRVKFIGTENFLWVTDEGISVKERFEPGFVSHITSKNKALNLVDKSFDISEKTSVKSDFEITNPRDVKYLKAKLSGIHLTQNLNVEDGYSQFRQGEFLIIRSVDISNLTSYNLPYNKNDLNKFLSPSNLIQSDNIKIIKLADKIVSDEKNSLNAAIKINKWVYDYLEKVPVVSVPSALGILESKKGDCNEHAVLFSSLSRAAGIPSKVVLGLVYLNGRFYYHAWNEVYLGKWVTADSTFGQIPADATHIKLLEGDISRSSEILSVVGKINLNVIEERKL